ncbi:MAG: hypothetical protein KBE19_05840 [Rhodocyclaceae bacterium]|jgi:hypothetical protein|nr:hypothetical protein [Rhodocyclaceae bacterium]
MDLNSVYKKTQKGQEEMAQRTVLGMRERTLLVMVDGKTTAADLLARAKHMPDPQGLLAKLIDGGFIAAEVAAAPAPAPAPGAAAPAQAVVSAQDQLIMKNAMRYAEHFLDQVLGPDADMLSEAIDRCKTLPELRTRLEKTRDAVAGMGKKRKAEEFWIAAQALLEGQAPPEAAPPAAAPAPPAPPPAAAPSPSAAPPAAPTPSLQETVRFARRYINDALGPDGDMLVEAIEKCKTIADLRAALEKTLKALQVGAGKRKAEEFWAGVEARLPPA